VESNLDVPMVHSTPVTLGDGVTHLGEHASDEPETSVGQESGRMEGAEETGRRGCPTGRVAAREGWRRIELVACGFEEIEQILAGDVFENEDEK
jgi:hypothetical protein